MQYNTKKINKTVENVPRKPKPRKSLFDRGIVRITKADPKKTSEEIYKDIQFKPFKEDREYVGDTNFLGWSSSKSVHAIRRRLN